MKRESRISFSNSQLIRAVCVFLIVLTMLGGYHEMAQDDSYIFFTYARNIAEGDGYVFNPGERINATTSPLYTVILAVVYRVVGSDSPDLLPSAAHIVGGICLVLLALLLGDCVRGPAPSLLPVVVPLAFLVNPLLTNAFGMEIFLALMLAVAGTATYFRSLPRTAACLSALAVLGRPDMIIVPGLLFAYHLYRNRRLPRVTTVAIFGAPLIAWLSFSWFYFGSFLPSTLAAKLAQSEAGLWGDRWTFMADLFAPASWYAGQVTSGIAKPLVLLIAIHGTGLVAGTAVMFGSLRTSPEIKRPAVLLLLFWSLLHFVAYAFVLRPPAYTWYYTPLAIGLAVLVALPLDRLYQSFRGTTENGQKVVTGTILIALTALGLWLPLASRGHRATGEFVLHREAAMWLNAHAPQGASVGTFDCDILGYFYEMGPVIDGLGLVTPAVVEHVRNHDFTWFIHDYRPDFLMLAHPPRGNIEGMASEPWFEQQYELRTVINAGSQEVAIYGQRR